MHSSKTLNQLFTRDASRARNLLVFGAIIYPIWGLVSKLSHINNFDPMWIRLLISGIFILIWWASFKIEFVQKNIAKAVELVGWVLTIHSLFLNFTNHWGFVNFTGFIILGGVMYSVMRSYRSALLFSIMYVGAFSLCFSDAQAKTDPKFMFVSVFSVAVVGMITMRTRLETFEALMQEELRNSVFFSAMREGAAIYKHDGEVHWYNDAILKILNLDPLQFMRKEPRPEYFKFLTQDGCPLKEEDTSIGRCLQTGVAQVDETIGAYVSETEIRWIRMSAIPFKMPDA